MTRPKRPAPKPITTRAANWAVLDSVGQLHFLTVTRKGAERESSRIRGSSVVQWQNLSATRRHHYLAHALRTPANMARDRAV